ncbi:MAG TPA: MBL fold metallo-hydrolase [Candidatus Binataceae bacterium]|nr:MBL fold metallo-hydrolase [Candidatus Binataceae bacterium]
MRAHGARWRMYFAAFLAVASLAPGIPTMTDYIADRTVAAERNGMRSSILQPNSWSDEKLTIANLGHATMLIDFFGVRVLSDPSLFDRVGFSIEPLFTIGPRRIVPAPLGPDDLSSINVILITHAHMDHLDVPSLRVLPKNAVVVACSGCAKLVGPLGYSDVRELRWGQATEIAGLKITAMGARHWGKRWPPFGGSYGFNSYVLEKNGRRMLVACDSAYTDLFGALATTPPDIAAFSIGAYDPWIWNHANPEEVWRMFRQTDAKYIVPIHWGTFKLSNEPMDEPIRRLEAAAGAEENRIVIRDIGGVWTFPQEPETPHAMSVNLSAARGR